MSHHIDGNSTPPPRQHHCGDMSFNHETGEMQGLPECSCAPSEIGPTRLDLLIVQYEELLRETAAARDALIEAALGLSGIETQTDAAANRQAIIDAITAALPTDYAKEAAATSNKEAILAAINSVQPDLSTVAKQGTNPDATNTAILAAINSVQPDLSTVAKQGTNPDATNTAIIAAIPVECSTEDIDRMFTSVT